MYFVIYLNTHNNSLSNMMQIHQDKLTKPIV